MSPDLQACLANDYPHILGIITKPGMPGIQCPDGWISLLDDLFLKLALQAASRSMECPVALQVIEKEGRLHLAFRHADWYAHELMKQAERRSSSLCVVCGRPGEPSSSGARCAQHALQI